MILYADGIQKLIQALDKREFSESMDKDYSLWYLMTAFRGPDQSDGDNFDIKRRREIGYIKKSTTNRIRNWVMNFGSSDPVEDDEEFFEVNPLRYTKPEIRKCCGSHFVGHLADAAKTIRLLDPSFKVFREEGVVDNN